MIDRDLPLKKVISTNIKKFMDQRGWTQLKLSEVSGVSKSTLSDYINCNTLANPGNIEKLARAFGVEKQELDPSFAPSDYVKEDSVLYSIETVSFLPIYGNISCGNGAVIYEAATDYEPTPQKWTSGGDYFYLTAKGDSMVGAKIHEGDLLLIRKQETVELGEIAAVVIDDEVVLKRVYRNDGSFTLVSENPNYPPRIFNPDTDKNIRIIGKLKKSITNH